MPQLSYRSLAASGLRPPKSISSTVGRMYFDTLAERFLEHCRLHVKRATLVNYELALRHFGALAGSVRIGSLTSADIDRFVAAERKRGVEPGGTNNRLRAVKACLRWAVAEKLLPEMPCRIRMLRVPKVVGEKALSRDDVDRLLAAAGPRDRALILVSAATGLRIAEVLHLKWRDLAGDQLRVSSKPEVQWTTKSHAERLVYLPERVLAELRTYRAGLLHCEDDCWMFQSTTHPGERLTTVAKRGREIFEAAGVYRSGKVWHELRRACATAMAANGVDLNTIRDQLGHADISTTQRYLRIDEGAKRAAASKGVV